LFLCTSEGLCRSFASRFLLGSALRFLVRRNARFLLSPASRRCFGRHAGLFLCTSEGLCRSFASRFLLGSALRCGARFLRPATRLLLGAPSRLPHGAHHEQRDGDCDR
jgi:hypothetical protein